MIGNMLHSKEIRPPLYHSPMIIANNILKRSFADDVPVNAMKLQKLLYFTASEYSKLTNGKQLFEERFQPWRYGPVLRSLYNKTAVLEGDPLRKYLKDAEGNNFTMRETSQPELREALSRVWRHGKHLTAAELARITHLPESAWTKAYAAGATELNPDDITADTSYILSLNLI
jgi:uncharacterized phage-associated protein